MLIILLGPPAAGKGTQAYKICTQLKIPHISTGAILRQSIKEKTPLGQIALVINKGEFVPDDVMTDAIKKRLSQKDCEGGALLDGFPRTIPQAIALDAFATPDRVINIEVSRENLFKRVTGRRMCEKCSESFHVDSLNGETHCRCGGKFYIREDDTEEVFAARLDIYERLTLPIKEYYLKKGRLRSVSGEGSQDEVYKRIIAELNA